MRQFTIVLLLATLMIIISACTKSPTSIGDNNMASQNIIIPSSTNNNTDLNNSDNNIGNDSKDNIDMMKKQMFLGKWTINKMIATGRVSEYGDDEVNKLLNKKVQYMIDYASFEDNILKNPYYKITRISKNDFFDGNYVSFEQLGMKKDTIDKVEVYSNKELNKPWDFTGGTFYIKGNNSLIIYDGGIYFELTKTN